MYRLTWYREQKGEMDFEQLFPSMHYLNTVNTYNIVFVCINDVLLTFMHNKIGKYYFCRIFFLHCLKSESDIIEMYIHSIHWCFFIWENAFDSKNEHRICKMYKIYLFGHVRSIEIYRYVFHSWSEPEVGFQKLQKCFFLQT